MWHRRYVNTFRLVRRGTSQERNSQCEFCSSRHFQGRGAAKRRTFSRRATPDEPQRIDDHKRRPGCSRRTIQQRLAWVTPTAPYPAVGSGAVKVYSVSDGSHSVVFAPDTAASGAKLGSAKGINLPETAVDFGETGRLFPKDFTPLAYRDAIIMNMTVLKRAFPTSATMQYANFMPGEWLPHQDRSYLRSVYQRARELKVGVGGPDLLPYKPGQMNHSYPLIRECAGSIPTGIAVQSGNYEYTNPKTGKQIAISELIEFGQEYLKADYIFWCTQEPFYSGKLIPFFRAQR
jgi:hypothetical protein